MKKLLSILFLFIGSTAFAQTNSFTVSGKIKGFDTDSMSIYFEDENAPRGRFSDSIPVENGSFSYTTDIEGIKFVTIYPNVDRTVKKVKGGGYYPAKSSQLQFIASPGANIHFTGKITDFVDAYPSGNKASDDLATLNRKVFPLMNKAVNMQLKIANKEVTDSSKVKELKDSMSKLNKEAINIKKDFIRNHLASVAAAWLLNDMMLRSQISDETAIDLFHKMDKKKLVAVPFYIKAAKRVDGIVATAVGKQVPDINTRNTYNGKRFKLSSLRGKYVVLDFWGTWCGPCVSGMPQMKKYLNKYKDDLAIVGVAQDNEKSWSEFLDHHPEYHWHQVLSTSDENYILKFSIAGFPTKIIVDPQGNIEKRFVGEDEGFYEKLDELLN